MAFMHSCRCTHTDMKPENILFRYQNNYETVFDQRRRRHERRLLNTEILVIDLGSSVFDWEHHSKVISTRHYRAPEVIYGLEWDSKVDIWSVACILFEFYTGKTMFQTHENMEHLAMMEKILGRPPRTFVKLCKNKYYHRLNNQYYLNWDEKSDDGNYVKTQCKSLTRWNSKPSKADHQSFFDLLSLMLTYGPDKRPSAKTCMRHHIFQEMNPTVVYRTRKGARSDSIADRTRHSSTRTLSSTSSNKSQLLIC